MAKLPKSESRGPNLVGCAIRAALAHEGITQTELAERAEMVKGNLSQIMQGQRLSGSSLRNLCHSIVDPTARIALLIAHLRDEIQRAGFNVDDITLRPVDARVATKVVDFLALAESLGERMEEMKREFGPVRITLVRPARFVSSEEDQKKQAKRRTAHDPGSK
jgi:transcriptional regulator with XRE-family HTH domain